MNDNNDRCGVAVTIIVLFGLATTMFMTMFMSIHTELQWIEDHLKIPPCHHTVPWKCD